MTALESAIHQVMWHMNLRPLKLKQFEALDGFVSGRDKVVALLTGYGKSVILLLCLFCLISYWIMLFSYYYDLGIPSVILGAIVVVVVTPLISLMLYQKEKFTQKGLYSLLGRHRRMKKTCCLC